MYNFTADDLRTIIKLCKKEALRITTEYINNKPLSVINKKRLKFIEIAKKANDELKNRYY